jgi:hypothetical protein
MITILSKHPQKTRWLHQFFPKLFSDTLHSRMHVFHECTVQASPRQTALDRSQVFVVLSLFHFLIFLSSCLLFHLSSVLVIIRTNCIHRPKYPYGLSNMNNGSNSRPAIKPDTMNTAITIPQKANNVISRCVSIMLFRFLILQEGSAEFPICPSPH